MWITHDQAGPKHQGIWIMTRTTQISYPQLCVYPVGLRICRCHMVSFTCIPICCESVCESSRLKIGYILSHFRHLWDAEKLINTAKLSKLSENQIFIDFLWSSNFFAKECYVELRNATWTSETTQDVDRPRPLQNFSDTSADPKKSSTSIQTNTRERCLIIGCGPKWKCQQ